MSPLRCSLLLLLALALASVSVSRAAFCHHKPTPSPPNAFPISTPEPRFVRNVSNGALYEVQVHDQLIPLLHLWGSPYAKGFAHGTLMRDKLDLFIHQVFDYLVQKGARALEHLGVPVSTAEQLVTMAADVGLDLTSALTAPFTGPWYAEELQGLADGAGLDVALLRRVQMLGELTKGSCSMIGAWDDALQGGRGLLTVRALDWVTDGPFQNNHQLTVYHADTSPNVTTPERTFLTMGWTGWVGSITGVNDAQLSIHEIGVSYPDASFGAESRAGVPFTYVLRDILQFDSTRLDGLSRLASAHRTCDLILGVGDGKERRFNSVGYSASLCAIMDDTNQKPVADWHPRINSTTYHAMDWACIGPNEVMGAQLQSLWGRLTPEAIISDILPAVQTGNLHVYVADLPAMLLYVSFAAGDNSTAPQRNANDRQYAKLDLHSLFAVTQQQAGDDAQSDWTTLA